MACFKAVLCSLYLCGGCLGSRRLRRSLRGSGPGWLLELELPPVQRGVAWPGTVSPARLRSGLGQRIVGYPGAVLADVFHPAALECEEAGQNFAWRGLQPDWDLVGAQRLPTDCLPGLPLPGVPGPTASSTPPVWLSPLFLTCRLERLRSWHFTTNERRTCLSASCWSQGCGPSV